MAERNKKIRPYSGQNGGEKGKESRVQSGERKCGETDTVGEEAAKRSGKAKERTKTGAKRTKAKPA